MLANSMTRDYSALAGDCRGAVAASANPQVTHFSRNVHVGLEIRRHGDGDTCVCTACLELLHSSRVPEFSFRF